METFAISRARSALSTRRSFPAPTQHDTTIFVPLSDRRGLPPRHIFDHHHPVAERVKFGLCCNCNGVACKYPFCCQSPWIGSRASLLTSSCSSYSDEQMTDCAITVELQQADLWKKFHAVGTEMVLTKVGRRMFPPIEMIVSGLEKDAIYSMVLEIHCTDGNRYKYINTKWLAIGKSDVEFPDTDPSYVHPESPNQGSSWMKQMVSFKKAKLTNHKKNTKDIVLHSLHKYEPRFIIIKEQSESDYQQLVFTRELEECTFFAVTAYQSNQMTQLKIDYNPFAKAFRETAVAVSARSESRVCASRSLQQQQLSQVQASSDSAAGRVISTTWTLNDPRLQSTRKSSGSILPVGYADMLHCSSYMPDCSMRPRSTFTSTIPSKAVSSSAAHYFREGNNEHVYRPIPVLGYQGFRGWKANPNSSFFIIKRDAANANKLKRAVTQSQDRQTVARRDVQVIN